MSAKVNLTKKMAGLAVALVISSGAMLLKAGSSVEEDYICESGSTFYECEDASDCSGWCVQRVTDDPTKGCTAHPGGECEKEETHEGVWYTEVEGTCTHPTYDCGCEVPPGAKGKRLQQVFTCT
jgi:hypothetical protein